MSLNGEVRIDECVSCCFEPLQRAKVGHCVQSRNGLVAQNVTLASAAGDWRVIAEARLSRFQ
ncbi:hypothetical protein U91I_03493 [alpha proteobacterium U9-1i]|nr:hypothetical protein U91I_03493 [alpha proteobacterium U9-1i]